MGDSDGARYARTPGSGSARRDSRTGVGCPSIVNYPQEQSCYNASKAGVIQFGKSIAAEWAKYNIRVNCISPGYMDTALNRVPALEAQKKIWKSMTPQARLGNVDELNGLCVFLASDASSFMTGANVAIDGGYTCY